MARCAINVFQPPGPGKQAAILFDGQMRRSVGRLDILGACVVASGFVYESGRLGELTVTVQCVRTCKTAVRAELTFMTRAGTVLATQSIDNVAIAAPPGFMSLKEEQ